MRNLGRNMWVVMLGCLLFAVVGCGESPDVDMMKAGLERSGIPGDQAACFAGKMKDLGVEGEPYNYMAALMKEGLPEKDAVNKARRKCGAEFKTPMEAARSACVN